MKTNTEITPFNGTKLHLGQACLSSCRKLLAQMKKAKKAILTEFNGTFQAQEHLLRMALNEAEAVAWQTGFPQLVFADLAMEKVQSVASQAKQREMR